MKRYTFRENLQNRTIDPSKGSWDELDKKLTAHENKKKYRNWMILKIASFILLLVSIGIYFDQSLQDTLPAAEIAAPVSGDELRSLPDMEPATKVDLAEKSSSPEIEITENTNAPQTAEISTSSEKRKNSLIHHNAAEPGSEEMASLKKETNNYTFISRSEQDLIAMDTVTFSEEISSPLIRSEQDDLLDAEIDRLLHNSKLKLIVNGQISSKKYVNTDALLNSVEDDLDKDLRQKLIEKIVNTLKKDKEVVTSEEN